METKVKNNNGEYTVFVDPDPNIVDDPDDIYSVQVINETKVAAGELHVGCMTDEMSRQEAVSLYQRTRAAGNPEAYLKAVINRQDAHK